MSNIIKSYVVRYEEALIKEIDGHKKKEAEILQKRNEKILPQLDAGGFIEGISAAEAIFSPEFQEGFPQDFTVNPEYNPVQAREEALRIIEDAKQQAQELKEQAQSEGSRKGYEEGAAKSRQELQEQIRRLESEKQRLEKEYQDKVRQLEPQVNDIIITLIEKLTGVMAEDQSDVILYLVERAFAGIGKPDYIHIRAGKEDYEILSAQKEMLADKLDPDVKFEIYEDAMLGKNQCRIETEQKVLDCSLDVQLTNLIRSLRSLTVI